MYLDLGKQESDGIQDLSLILSTSDTNSNGQIGRDEFPDFFVSFRNTVNGEGKKSDDSIDIKVVLVNLVDTYQEQGNLNGLDEPLLFVFQHYDIDHSKELSPYEVTLVLTDLDAPNPSTGVDRLVLTADNDRDGEISYAEFPTLFILIIDGTGTPTPPPPSPAIEAPDVTVMQFVRETKEQPSPPPQPQPKAALSVGVMLHSQKEEAPRPNAQQLSVGVVVHTPPSEQEVPQVDVQMILMQVMNSYGANQTLDGMEQKLDVIFTYYDTDQSKELSSQEVTLLSLDFGLKGVDGVTEIFNYADRDGDRQLNKDEFYVLIIGFCKVLQADAQGETTVTTTPMSRQGEQSQDIQVIITQLVTGYQTSHVFDEPQLALVFQYYDGDQSGSLDMREVASIFIDLGLNNANEYDGIQATVEDADRDKNNVISPDEFHLLFAHVSERLGSSS